MSESAGTVAEQLRRIERRDREAAAWLYDTFAGALFRRLLQRYGYLGEAEIEDLLQETFLGALRDDGRLLRRFLDREGARASGEALARFLWDQACGMASNRRRSAPFRKVVAIDDQAHLAAAEREEQQTIDRDLVARLDACIGERGGTRTYLYYKLRFRDGLTPEEVAAATGWSRKATYKLRQSLDEVVQKCAAAIGLGRAART